MFTFSIKKKFLLFIATVVFSFGLNQLIIQYYLIDQAYFSTTINQAGRQRMLSQKFAKIAYKYYSEMLIDDSYMAIQNKREASAVLDELTHSQEQLIKSNQEKGKDFKADSLLRVNLEIAIGLRNELALLTDSREDESMRNALYSISELEQTFLWTMESTVFRFEEMAQEQLYWLSVLDIVLAIIWIVSITAIFFYTIYPSIQALAKKNKALTEANNQLGAAEKQIRNNLFH
jgi:hypothetical protein